MIKEPDNVSDLGIPITFDQAFGCLNIKDFSKNENDWEVLSLSAFEVKPFHAELKIDRVRALIKSAETENKLFFVRDMTFKSILAFDSLQNKWLLLSCDIDKVRELMKTLGIPKNQYGF